VGNAPCQLTKSSENSFVEDVSLVGATLICQHQVGSLVNWLNLNLPQQLHQESFPHWHDVDMLKSCRQCLYSFSGHTILIMIFSSQEAVQVRQSRDFPTTFLDISFLHSERILLPFKSLSCTTGVARQNNKILTSCIQPSQCTDLIIEHMNSTFSTPSSTTFSNAQQKSLLKGTVNNIQARLHSFWRCRGDSSYVTVNVWNVN
jgi:hypothetical protein